MSFISSVNESSSLLLSATFVLVSRIGLSSSFVVAAESESRYDEFGSRFRKADDEERPTLGDVKAKAEDVDIVLDATTNPNNNTLILTVY